MDLLRAATRPVTLRFKDQSFLPAAPTPNRKARTLATFTEVGTLGLKFKPLELATQTGVQLTGTTEATQAAAHPHLTPGLVLASMESGGQRREGLEGVAFKAVVQLLREVRHGALLLPSSFFPPSRCPLAPLCISLIPDLLVLS